MKQGPLPVVTSRFIRTCHEADLAVHVWTVNDASSMNTLLDQGLHTSWHTVRDTLQTHQVCTVVLPTDGGAVLRIRKGSTPEPEHRALYELLALRRPHRQRHNHVAARGDREFRLKLQPAVDCDALVFYQCRHKCVS